MFLRRTLALCVSIAAVVGCAFAQDDVPDTTGAPKTLKLDLIGTVPGHCGFKTSPRTDAALGDLATAGSSALTFTLDCSTPFDVRVSARRGALTHIGAVSASAEFAQTLDYDVSLSIVTDLGSVGSHCAANTLASGATCALATQGLSSGNGVAIGTDGSIAVSWTTPAAKLVAGSYQDALTITVEART